MIGQNSATQFRTFFFNNVLYLQYLVGLNPVVHVNAIDGALP